MEPNVGETQVYFSSNPWFKRKLFWIIFTLVMILIPVGAWVYANYFMKPATPPVLPPPAAKNTLEENNSPIAFDILQNPMVYEWRGSVEGTLVSKNDKSIILKRDGKRIIIPIDPTSTKFLPQSAIVKGELNKSLAFDEVTINDYLQGDFFVFPNQNGKVVGSSFIVRNK